MEFFPKERVKTFESLPWFSEDNFSTWITSHIAPFGQSICDIGAGTGIIIENFLRHFDTVITIEPCSEMMLTLLKKANSNACHIVKARGESIPLINNCVDIAISKSSLHHFSDVLLTINEMARIAKRIVAIAEVISPDDICLPFLKSLLLKKEPNRLSDTIFSEQQLLKIFRRISSNVRCLHYDQYIGIQPWLQNCALDINLQNEIIELVESQEGVVKDIMQIHTRDNKLLMLRRMVLVMVEMDDLKTN